MRTTAREKVPPHSACGIQCVAFRVPGKCLLQEMKKSALCAEEKHQAAQHKKRVRTRQLQSKDEEKIE